MNRYKNLKCNSCGKKATSANGKAKKCACGSTMTVGENWYLRYMHNGKNIVEAVSPRICDVEQRIAAIRLNGVSTEKPITWKMAPRSDSPGSIPLRNRRTSGSMSKNR